MPDIVIGAKQIPNPKGIKVSADTDRPKPKPPAPLPGGAKMDTSNPYGRGTDVSNPPMNRIEPEPKKHPIDELFGRGIKRSNGRSIPKADVEISDN